jgi:VanZ family protein
MHMRLQVSSRVWLLILLGYWVILFVSTHIPNQLLGPPGRISDKILHFSAFCMLALLVALNAEWQFGEMCWRHYAILAIVMAVFGALDEILQQFVNRHCSFKDWVADICGMIVGLWLYYIFRSSLRKLVGH